MVSVALFAADEDGVLVRLALRESGMTATGAYVMEVQSGACDLHEFLQSSKPDVVIYDYVQPPGRSTRRVDDVRRVCEKLEIPCVLTVRDVHDLQRLAVGWAACILIRPYDVDMARLAIREALQAGAGEGQADVDDDDGGDVAA